MKRRRLDLYWILALAGLFVAGPFSMGFIMWAKTGTAPAGFFFNVLPGAGIALVGTLGGALVAKTAFTATDAPKRLRIGLGIAWMIQFAAMALTLPIYMLGAAIQVPIGASDLATRSMTLLETVEWLLTAGPAGAITLVILTFVIFGMESTIPALLVASAYQSGQTAVRVATADEHRKTVREGSAKDYVLVELGQGPATAVELVERSTYAESTITAALRDLRNAGQVTTVPGSSPFVFKLVTEPQQIALVEP